MDGWCGDGELMALEWDMYSWNLNERLRDEDLMVLEWDIYYWELSGRLRDGDRRRLGIVVIVVQEADARMRISRQPS